MTDCCQGTSSPTGKLCGNCPHRKAPDHDMSPEAIGRRLKNSNLRGDEPWPGWSNGRPLIEKETPPPPDDDEPDYSGIHFVQIDVGSIDKAALEEFERRVREAMTIPPRFLEPAPRIRGFYRGLRYDLSPGGTEYDSLHAHDHED